ncbi:MAG: GNAT family N-acetyltransferase [Candidatus Faecivicinus sp.]
MHVRQAAPGDAEALFRLNAAFNGEGLGTAAHIERSLREGREIVCIAELDGEAAGFCCAQVTSSMCYMSPVGEITELYVRDGARRRGLARRLVRLAEQLCAARGAEELHLLTGRDNAAARALYASLGYAADDEVHYVRQPGADDFSTD